MRENEVLREAVFGAFGLRRGRDKPIDQSDELVPDQHLRAAPDDFCRG
ncbi:MAG: hypothetical protein WCE35_15910 [Bradyrhizobium sp.]